MNPDTPVIVSGGFDDVRSRHLRFLQEAAVPGPVTVLVWPDTVVERHTGRAPKCPLAERLYLLNALRYVASAIPLADDDDVHTIPSGRGVLSRIWIDDEAGADDGRRAFCRQHGIEYRVLPESQLAGFPALAASPSAPGRKRVVVSGSFDWFHTGHVRFLEEAAALGDLYAIVGHDANIRLLKGEGHPLFPQDERRYMVGSVKYVHDALVSCGNGWLDADPDIQRIKPDVYVVNEDGDRGGKREYCARLGIEYLVLRRTPAPGLPPRSSTDLRGF